jgi:hypothetical protein
MLSQIFAITPGGVGQTQALDIATLRKYAPSGDIAAFSVTQDSIITIWNVVLGLGLLLWAFGFSEAKRMLLRREPPEEAALALRPSRSGSVVQPMPPVTPMRDDVVE